MIFADENAPETTTFREILPQGFQTRYLKLKILEGRATDGPFVRINEIDISGSECSTGIVSIKDKPLFDLQKGILTITVPASTKHMNLSLYALNGTMIHQENFTEIRKGQEIKIKNLNLKEKAFIINYQDDFKTYSTKIAQ